MIQFDHKFLFRGPILSLVDIWWHAHDHRPTVEFDSTMPEITFMRSGLFVRRQGRLGVSCDPNTLLFTNVDESYRMAHPIEARCACTALLIDPVVLRDLIRPHDPAVADHDSRIFSFDCCPCAPEATVDHYALLGLARAPGGPDPLAVEEAGLTLARRVVASGYRFHGRRAVPGRSSTQRAHADLAQAVREILGARYREPLGLDEIARAVHAAPNHLCTVFKRQTGLTIHQYVTRLRLAAAVETLSDLPPSFAALASQLGFCHHSHFTTAFRRVFGEPPSRLVRRIGGYVGKRVRA